MKKNIVFIIGLLFIFSSCASYNYAQKVKTISFDNDVTTGKAIGPIRGEDCTWVILGMQFGDNPTIEKAVTNARKQGGGLESLRYINNATTSNDGFNAVLFETRCLVLTGVGYK